MLDFSLFWKALPILLVGGVILVGLKLLLGGFNKYPYRRLDTLFTPAETNFYYALVKAIGNEYRIFGKVRVADVLTPKKRLSKSGWWKSFTRISSKHVDYILVNQKMEFVCAIELDDSSHGRKERIKRDVFLDGAFEAAGMPLMRVPARRQYDVNEIRYNLKKSIGLANTPSVQSEDSTQDCPKCGSRLEQKVAKKGPNAGNPFLGCSGFPKCRYTRNPA